MLKMSESIFGKRWFVNWHKVPAEHCRRQGAVYIIVLAVVVNVTVIGLTAIYLARVRLKDVYSNDELREARLLAYSAVEHAIGMMNNYTGGTGNWRNDYINGQEITPINFSNGHMSFKLVDGDGDLADDPTDPLWIDGIGRVGDAIWVERAKARINQGLPLEFLRTVIHSRRQFDIQLAQQLTVSGAPSSTDSELLNNGTLVGDVEALSLSGSGSITGNMTIPAEKKGVPPQSLYDWYLARATTLTFSGNLQDIVLGPGVNEYDGSGANPDGMYYINTGGSNLDIQTMRLCGTLIVDVGAGTLNIYNVSMEPYREDFPVLIVKGNMYQNTDGGLLDESWENHNYNPVGAPYHAETDSDQSDTYSPGIRGLMHVIGDVELVQVANHYGVIVVDGRATINGLVNLVHDPDLMFNPPLGYTDDPNSTAMIIRGHSWSRQYAPQ